MSISRCGLQVSRDFTITNTIHDHPRSVQMRCWISGKRQEGELKQLEDSHPGITSLKKDEEGNLVLPEISDAAQELSEIISESKLSIEQD